MVRQGCPQHLPMLVSNFQYSHQISTKTIVVKCYYLNYVKCKTMQTLLVSGSLQLGCRGQLILSWCSLTVLIVPCNLTPCPSPSLR